MLDLNTLQSTSGIIFEEAINAENLYILISSNLQFSLNLYSLCSCKVCLHDLFILKII